MIFWKKTSKIFLEISRRISEEIYGDISKENCFSTVRFVLLGMAFQSWQKQKYCYFISVEVHGRISGVVHAENRNEVFWSNHK